MNKQGKCPVVQGQDYEVSITDLGIHGEGIGKVNGFTVFVPGALPGERAKVRIIRVKKSYATGKLVTLKEQTPHRVKPECPVYDRVRRMPDFPSVLRGAAGSKASECGECY